MHARRRESWHRIGRVILRDVIHGGRFMRPLRDSTGDTATWLQSLERSHDTAARVRVWLVEHGWLSPIGRRVNSFRWRRYRGSTPMFAAGPKLRHIATAVKFLRHPFSKLFFNNPSRYLKIGTEQHGISRKTVGRVERTRRKGEIKIRSIDRDSGVPGKRPGSRNRSANPRRRDARNHAAASGRGSAESSEATTSAKSSSLQQDAPGDNRKLHENTDSPGLGGSETTETGNQYWRSPQATRERSKRVFGMEASKDRTNRKSLLSVTFDSKRAQTEHYLKLYGAERIKRLLDR